MSEPTHSPLPWSVEQMGGFAYVLDADGETVANVGNDSDAARIVRTGNAHAAVVEALQGLLAAHDAIMEAFPYKRDSPPVVQARAALAAVAEQP